MKVFADRKADKKTRTSQSEIGRRNHKANFQPLIDKFGSRLLIDLTADDIEKWFQEREARREKETAPLGLLQRGILIGVFWLDFGVN